MLCQVMPVEEGKSVCTTCWRLAPGWVKKKFMRGERVEWSRLLERVNHPATHLPREDNHGSGTS